MSAKIADPLPGYLDLCFGKSEPGDSLHHLIIATAPVNALGLPDPTRPK